MKNKPKTLVLLDGNALIHRAYHALPPLTTKKGEVVNAVYGFTATLLSVLEKFKPEYIAASFDLPGGTFRDDMYAEYKAKRQKAPDDLYAQIPRVKEVTAAFGIPIYEREGFEADDCVGALARQASATGVDTIIVTGDNDALQLVDDSVKVFTMRKGIKDTVLYDEAAVEAKYGFAPTQLPDYKGLAGDSSDNIPGVKGIGPKTASDLLQRYQTLEGIYEHIDEIKGTTQEKLLRDREQAFLSRELGRIDTQAPVVLDLALAETPEFDREAVAKLLQELGFFSLLKRVPGGTAEAHPPAASKKPKKAKKDKEVTTGAEVAAWFANHTERVAFVVSKGEGSLFGEALQSLELASDSDAVRIVWNEETKKALTPWLEDGAREKIAYDAKESMHLFAKEGIALAGVVFDIMIAAYLLDSGSNISLPYLFLSELGQEDESGKARGILELAVRYQSQLEEVSRTQNPGATLEDVFQKIEMPLLPLLYRMESLGIYLSTEKFRLLSEELTGELSVFESDIYKLAGREFNINSPKQLSEILFTDLQIPTTNIKKTKTGISTASSELGKLQEYPIIQKIESYRELFKLKTTYLDALPLLVDEASCLHTTFQQAVAATGRLSSTDPNLQNIPARNAWGERIRGAFEARPGRVLVGADYSQIELRIMAHLSQDKSLLASFRNGEDVHRTTAAIVYKVKPEEVTADMRRQAKVFNFGIMYGMGAFGLAQAADITQQEASEFINAYFKKFAGVKIFIETLKKGARENKFVETELGRRRYIPEIESANFQVVRSAERMAVNMPIQGLEADIVKLAMLAVDEKLGAYAADAKPLLQVHDEIIYEVKKEKAEAFGKELQKVLEDVYKISVPLTVEVSIGDNWGEI